MAADPGSRYGFEYARDRESNQWVHLHCELRVPTARELPAARANEGEPIQFTRFMPGAMATAGISAAEFDVRGNYRVWLYRGVADDADFAGRSGIGVQAIWPDSAARTRHESMEVLPIPALNSMRPYVWSSWAPAKEFRPGQFAGWEKTSELASAASAPPEFPFELRCRPVLSDVVYVSTREMDPNIAMPDPAVAR